MNLYCSVCGRTYPLDTRLWLCECGGTFEVKGAPAFSHQAIRTKEPTLWRYRPLLPVEQDTNIVSLGEGFTPLLETKVHGVPVFCKLEFLSPTGSFKDRGTTVLVSLLQEMGVKEVVEDSSGNAAASLAAYCARAGIRARIFVPAHASPAKLAQIAVYGAELVAVEGPREASAQAAQHAASKGPPGSRAYYASHNYSPFFVEGTKTFAYEIWEYLGAAPHNLFFPLGNGSLLMGAYRGFSELKEAGLVDRVPRLFAVQAEACSPFYQAYQQGWEDTQPVPPGQTIAEGIRIAQPVRGRLVLQAIRETEGAVFTVGEAEIVDARKALAGVGLYVEPTSATVAAAFHKMQHTLAPQEITILALTGAGLKSP
ncbi:MAG: pyridoxal-phosphate dependent enzyme [Chloroflexi bacterium]|nr:pyridoxal-phosphate dependent enzyme [Chloroflexota bacterium]